MRLAGLLICVCVLFAQAASAADPSYTLNPGDQLVVSSFDDERLNREVVVLPDGTISYLAIGQLKAQGKTATQLEAEIAEALVQKGFLQPGSVISVSVSRTAGNTIYVLGQVKNPGAFSTPSAVDVMQALSLAGGLTAFASRGNIKILRNEDGRQIVFEFDYSAVEDGEDLETNIILRSGDTVVVPD